ncbi:MAG: GNAT family N-acetyltransferase [Ruminiclostridium sp.]
MPLKNFGTTFLQTKRLILRKFENNDIYDMMQNWICDTEVQSNYGEPAYQTNEEVQDLLQKWISLYKGKAFYRWAIVLKETNCNIGQIAFCRTYDNEECAEIEYCIGKAYWGNGFATEALREILKYSFEQIGLNKIEAFHRVKNPASGRVLNKAGMKQVENITRYEESNAYYKDRVFYAYMRKKYIN